MALAGRRRSDVALTPDVTRAGGTRPQHCSTSPKSGAAPSCATSIRAISPIAYPPWQALDLPFAIQDRAASLAPASDGAPRRKRLRAAIEAATGYRVLGFWGQRLFVHVTNRVRPIRWRRRLRGALRLRTVGSALHHEIFARRSVSSRWRSDVKDLAHRRRLGPGRYAQENPLTNTVEFLAPAPSPPHQALTAHFLRRRAAARQPRLVRRSGRRGRAMALHAAIVARDPRPQRDPRPPARMAVCLAPPPGRRACAIVGPEAIDSRGLR